MIVGYNRADKFVENLQSQGVDVRWNGWDMVFFEPNVKARKSVKGHFRNGHWGFENVVSPRSTGDLAGKWVVSNRLMKRTNA